MNEPKIPTMVRDIVWSRAKGQCACCGEQVPVDAAVIGRWEAAMLDVALMAKKTP